MIVPLLRPRDLAERLLVSEQTVRNLAASGEIAAIYFRARRGKNGRDRMTLRFTEEALRDFIERKTNKGKEAR